MSDLPTPLSVAIDAALLLVVLVLLQEAVRHGWRGARSGLRYGETYYGRLQSWIGQAAPVAFFRERYPGVSGFLGRRFAVKSFAGLPLTLVAVALVYLAMLFAGIVEELFEKTELLSLDTAIFAAIEPVRTDAVLLLFGWITRFGDATTIIAVAVVVTAMLWAHGPRRFVLPFWISVLGAQLTTTLGKYVLDRSRPDFAAEVPDNPSFPSGHSASAVSTYLLLAYLLVRDMAPGDRRVVVVYWLAALAGLIALSRFVLGVHYASDVAAGVLVGAFWVAVAIAVAELIKTGTPMLSESEEEADGD